MKGATEWGAPGQEISMAVRGGGYFTNYSAVCQSLHSYPNYNFPQNANPKIAATILKNNILWATPKVAYMQCSSYSVLMFLLFIC